MADLPNPCACDSCQITRIIAGHVSDKLSGGMASLHIAELVIHLLARSAIDSHLAVMRDGATWFCSVPRDCIEMMLPYLSPDGWFAGYHHSFAPRFSAERLGNTSGVSSIPENPARYGYRHYNATERVEGIRAGVPEINQYHYVSGAVVSRDYTFSMGYYSDEFRDGYLHGVVVRDCGIYSNYHKHYVHGIEIIKDNKLNAVNSYYRPIWGSEHYPCTGPASPEIRRLCFARPDGMAEPIRYRTMNI